MKLLLVLNERPYGRGVIWNALRLAEAALSGGSQIRIYLVSDAVTAAAKNGKPEAAKFDIAARLEELAGRGAAIKICEV